mgnify:CR=1 FL=1
MKIIGSGTYGCIIKPAIPCKNKKTKKNKVSKIARVKEQNTEYDISTKLFSYGKKKNIKVQDYLCLIEDFCEPDVSKLNATLKKKCSIISENKKSKKLISLIMDDCGIILNKMIKNNGCEQKDFEDIIINLLKGLEILHKNKLVHGDIKENNILVKNKKAKLIDFGGSVDITKYDLVKFLKTLIITSTYVAPELAFLYLILNNTIYSENLKELNLESNHYEYLVNYDRYRMNKLIYDDSGYGYDKLRNQRKEKKIICDFFDSLEDKKKYENFLKDFKKNIYKTDIYSLGKAFEYLVLDYKLKITKKIQILIKKMTHLDFKKRISLKECLDYMKKK